MRVLISSSGRDRDLRSDIEGDHTHAIPTSVHRCPAGVCYRASKYALESYGRSAAAELGPFGITVNIVSPGPAQTGYSAPEMEEGLIRDIFLRRVGQPSDIADAIVFLGTEPGPLDHWAIALRPRWTSRAVRTIAEN